MEIKQDVKDVNSQFHTFTADHMVFGVKTGPSGVN